MIDSRDFNYVRLLGILYLPQTLLLFKFMKEMMDTVAKNKISMVCH